MNQTLKRVLVIGGGYGGTAIAKALDTNFDVTLIEKRERFFHNSGSLRPQLMPDGCGNYSSPTIIY